MGDVDSSMAPSTISASASSNESRYRVRVAAVRRYSSSPSWNMPGYGIGCTMSASGVARLRNGASACSPSAAGPAYAIRPMTTALPWCSAGMNGMGGAFITMAIVVSSSGAASAAAANPATTSGVAGSSSMPPTNSRTSWSRNRNRVTTPKLPPPPRMAQNRSGWLSASTRSDSPSAVTTSAASRLSMVRPCLRAK